MNIIPSFILFLIANLVFQGCLVTHYIPENEMILQKQSIVGVKNIDKKELIRCYTSKVNSRYLGMPIKLWVYQIGRKYFNRSSIERDIDFIENKFTKKIAEAVGNSKKIRQLKQRQNKIIAAKKKKLKQGNRLMYLGEMPVLYESEAIKKTERRLFRYLQSQGYFDAVVSSTVTHRNHKAYVTYQIQENDSYVLGISQLDIPDSKIQKLCIAYQKESFIKQGNKYTQETFLKEKERLYNLLCDHGYFNFDEQYITFVADINATDHTVAITTCIRLPEEGTQHILSSLDHVVFSTTMQKKIDPLSTVVYRGIFFNKTDHCYNLKALSRKILLQPGSLYNKRLISDTYTSLHRLKMFNTIDIIPQVSTEGHLTTYIHAIPFKKYKFNGEIGIEILDNHPRFTLKPSFTLRRLLGVLDILTLEPNITFGRSNINKKSNFYRNIAGGINCKLEIPQFVFPFFYKIHTALDPFMPTTNFLLSYTICYQSNNIERKNKFSALYNWQTRNGNILYEFSPWNLDITYSDRLDPNTSLVHNIGCKIMFKNSTSHRKNVTYTDYYKWNLIISLENGGLLQSFSFIQKWMKEKKIKCFQYWKFDISYIQHVPFLNNVVFAYQVKVGVATPYGMNRCLPVEKYYMLGGNNTLRAWEASEDQYIQDLSVGSKKKSAENQKMHHNKLLLQGNFEFRKKLVSILEGAFFVDIGNVWTLHIDAPPEQKFTKNFYQDLALGSGFGLRVNLQNIFILCFDLGLKLHKPTKSSLPHLYDKEALKSNFHFNFGIDYPF